MGERFDIRNIETRVAAHEENAAHRTLADSEVQIAFEFGLYHLAEFGVYCLLGHDDHGREDSGANSCAHARRKAACS